MARDDERLALTLDHALRVPADRNSCLGGADELAHLVRLAHAVQTSKMDVVPSEEFRASSRARLVARMATAGPQPGAWHAVQRMRRRLGGWFARLAAGLAGLSLAGLATATASASALPGEPTYAIKQLQEQLALQSATTNAARAEVLLHQSDTRLDEAARLLERGQTMDALAAARRYDATVELAVEGVDRDEATTGEAASPAVQQLETALQTERARISALLSEAPGGARPALERARAAAERGLAHAARRRGKLDQSSPAMGQEDTADSAASGAAQPPSTSASPSRAEAPEAEVPEAGAPDAAPPVQPASGQHVVELEPTPASGAPGHAAQLDQEKQPAGGRGGNAPATDHVGRGPATDHAGRAPAPAPPHPEPGQRRGGGNAHTGAG